MELPHIDNVILSPTYSSNSTFLSNMTCAQCLCISSLSYPALNCFPSNACQLFYTFPSTYRIEYVQNARLYFPQQRFPNASQCCMPDIYSLLSKLNASQAVLANVSNPRDAIIDNNSYLVTVEESTNYFIRFNSKNLTRITYRSFLNPVQTTVVLFNNVYYTANIAGIIMAIDSQTLSILSNISTGVSGIRGMIFLNDGETMVVTACESNKVVFLNRTSISPISYNISFSKNAAFKCPHGIWRVNDSVFYVTSNTNNSLHLFRRNGSHKEWDETFVLKMSAVFGNSARLTIDECNRFWFTFETDTILIYHQNGTKLASWTIPSSAIFDIKIMSNYLMFITESNTGRARRIQPNIQC
ncbi:unnamed protein product [Adineta ricciae]|uniref:Uncharacterized protein n=1 Tax=Adineta ricciae TaxID=249248 RepID=A0A815K7B5_ADIRI|nr:unnamed protein product [Adineta ricciae]CAF1389511.1 unnamed protein product [Adineta ricciae]